MRLVRVESGVCLQLHLSPLGNTRPVTEGDNARHILSAYNYSLRGQRKADSPTKLMPLQEEQSPDIGVLEELAGLLCVPSFSNQPFGMPFQDVCQRQARESLKVVPSTHLVAVPEH